MTGVGDTIDKDGERSASAGIKVTLKIGNLPMMPRMRAGSSVVLYLEDDFQVPDSIARNTVYFTVTNNPQKATGEGGRVYVTDPIEIEEDNYYGGDDDTSIRVYLPDFNTGDGYDGFQGPDPGQTLTLVITEAGGHREPARSARQRQQLCGRLQSRLRCARHDRRGQGYSAGGQHCF